ncbi:hypothetical protein COT63_01565 [Candidatus Shapirobacteria bacterium CG09_land_8_20_14_0_10_38_17]|uniref:Uncharacterized protein n=1 Tax=Candidatus Shapirobacteria bacterium CG09_land_8_20_14_0_10_38_17 TaxID=1974884 RepID=A0A2H0WT90_9BACT|nr:MAG: hypothetical protein COT63_01565 [Candidatus Shapirobacteria bacterium CG09_land_8_20_14_0_10_38_17]
MKERDDKPRLKPKPEVFIIRPEKRPILEYFNRCRPLYGSDIRVDIEGNIFYPTWRQVRREEINPENYDLLSRKRIRPEIYLNLSLSTKNPYELRIHQVKKDGGSVEAGIRSIEHVIETETKKETPQAKMVQERINQLFSLFSNFSSLTKEDFKIIQGETYTQLARVGFNPETVMLEEKQKISHWLIKGSGGKDSLSRLNSLITTMALQAAYHRAIERELSIDQILTKFIRMHEALTLAREFSREILTDAHQWLEPQRLPAYYLFRYPQKPPQNVGVTVGILNTLSWQLTQPPVKPYRPTGLAAREPLIQAVGFLKQNQREEINQKGLFQQASTVLRETLEKYQSVHPTSA